MIATMCAPLNTNVSSIPLPQGGQASCGFPSPAADYELPDLSIDELIGIKPSSSIFLLRAWGDSMREAGIYDGDVLVVDKAKDAQLGNIVVAVVGSEFVVKRVVKDPSGQPFLQAENSSYEPIRITEDEPLQVWGVCVWVLHNLCF